MKKLALTALAAFAATLAYLPEPAEAGIHYRAVTTVQTEGKRKVERTEVEGWIEGDNARVEFKESRDAMAKTGTYLLTQDGGQTVYLVNPKDETYSEFDVAAMFGVVGAMTSGMGGAVDLDFVDPGVEFLGEEEGDEVLGYPTRHFRVKTQLGVRIKVFGMKRGSDIETVQDIWTTDALPEAGLGVYLRKDPPPTGDPEIDQMLAAQIDQVEGFPLLTRSVSTSVDTRKGKETKTTTTTEVVELSQKKLTAEPFQIPKDFEKVDLVPPEMVNPLKALRGGDKDG